mgnify:CR=1 FL=1|tara:strand:- start:1591 stop:2460 length:870 start_codon:yes stop_codon:yes gene_type:complete
MYKDKKIILFVFASLDLKKSIDRLKKQASASNFYDLIKVITPDDFDYETKLKVKKFMKDNKRGYGYWFWKPFFLSKILKEINYGDVVHYIDIGCHINKAGSKRFYEYLDFLNDKNRWLLAFQYHVENIKFSDEIEFQNREEFKYTKSDLLDYFNSLDVDEITITPQFWAGSFFIKKHPESEKFINNWNKVFENNFHLIDDTPSKIPNLPGFIENRHDQSVFSLLCKTNSIYSLSAYESEWGEKNNSRTWEHLSNYPIIAKRDLEYNIFKRFINRQIKNFKRKKSYFFRQ